METKFLSDGRKVVVVGALNNQETIVQEVFVTHQGDEIPGGERFVVKSLHDHPVETYLSREKKRQEAELDKTKRKIESMEREIADARNKLSFWGDMLKSVNQLSQSINEADFSHFLGVMTGRFKYAVENCYSVPSIQSIEECLSQVDNWHGNKRYEGLRLLSVLGNSEGNIAYKVNQYRDGSGSYSDVHFFETYEDARDHVKALTIAWLEKYALSVEELKKCKAMGIVFSQSEIEAIRAKLIERSSKSIEHATKTFEDAKSKVEADIAYIDKLITDI